MQQPSLPAPNGDEGIHDATPFYRHVLEVLSAAGIPFLVGGAYAFRHYTGIFRNTKDLDLFVLRADYDRLSAALQQAGYRSEMTYPHWLAKVHANGDFIDLIFNSGNGIAEVDHSWFEHAPTVQVLGIEAKISPIEEMIWSKAFIMERERYDGADIAHLLRAYGDRLDWQHLLNRFGASWRVLLAHITLYGFIYPAHRNLVPVWVMEELVNRLRQEMQADAPDQSVCLGTLLSREQYLVDIEQWGYRDGRLAPYGNMTEQQTSDWTKAIPGKENK